MQPSALHRVGLKSTSSSIVGQASARSASWGGHARHMREISPSEARAGDVIYGNAATILSGVVMMSPELALKSPQLGMHLPHDVVATATLIKPLRPTATDSPKMRRFSLIARPGQNVFGMLATAIVSMAFSRIWSFKSRLVEYASPHFPNLPSTMVVLEYPCASVSRDCRPIAQKPAQIQRSR